MKCKKCGNYKQHGFCETCHDEWIEEQYKKVVIKNDNTSRS